ncbi:MAG: hypothetical protein HDS35_09870 [Bacteroides sp.]|nr:hypothetical protein [Bacteroides sp.]
MIKIFATEVVNYLSLVEKFLSTYREKFRLTAIGSSMMFNFFMIYAAWAEDENAWTTTYIIAGIAIVSAIICQFTQQHTK